MSTRRKVEVVEMVSIEVPREMVGVVAGALSFAMEVQSGWPAALHGDPEESRYKNAIFDVIEALRKVQRESEKP